MLKRLGRIVLRAIRHPRAAWLSAFWFLAGKPQRARVVFLPARLKHDPVHYARWIEAFEMLSSGGCAPGLVATPTISVVMVVHDPDPAFLRQAIASVSVQTYGRWELCIVDDASGADEIADLLAASASTDPRIKVVSLAEFGDICRASNAALEVADGDIVAFLDQHDRLACDALLEIAHAATKFPRADVFYTDVDRIDKKGVRSRPHFKPDWNRELFLAQDYLDQLTAIRRSAIDRAGGFRRGYEGCPHYDLVLRLLGDADDDRVQHIPRVLYHRRSSAAGGSISSSATVMRRAKRGGVASGTTLPPPALMPRWSWVRVVTTGL